MALNRENLMGRLRAGIVSMVTRPTALWLRYCYAVFAVVLAVLVRFCILDPEAGDDFLTFYPAVALTVLFLGARPGLLAVVLSALAADYFFMPPFESFGLTFDQMLQISAFCLSGAIMCILARQISRNAEDAHTSKQLLQNIFDVNVDALLIIDSRGMITMANRQAEQLLGYAQGELLGRSRKVVIPDRFQAYHRALRSKFAPAASTHPMESLPIKALRKDGVEIDIEISLSSIQTDRGLLVANTLRDLNARNEAEADLRINAAAFESNDGIVVTDASGVIQRINRAFTKLTGYTPSDLVGKTPSRLKSVRHEADFYLAIWNSIVYTGEWRGEIWARRKNGEEYPQWLNISAVKNKAGVVTHYVGSHADITERKQAEAEIKDLAFFDQLTGLPNRTLFTDRLKQAILAAARSDNYGALLFIDLDNFKALNDTLGHDVGDKLLRQVAKRLIAFVREVDTVARLGGDEFMVLLTNLNSNERDAANAANAVAEKILASLRLPYSLGGITHSGTASIGTALFKEKRGSFDDLMKQADLAMYKSKAAGRDMVLFFDPAMEAALLQRAALEKDLREGLRDGHFSVYYQPQVIGAGNLAGAEALVRWESPQRGAVSPTEFILVAEETGLILPLGHWVLEIACRQLVNWAARQDLAHLTVAVNVSARQFKQPDFVDQVLAVLASTGANPQRLKLELTESLLVEDVQTLIDKMFALKSKGVGFTLDDFGTGYSSLSYLKRMPLDQLKIDQSFVRDILANANDAAIAKTIVALANSLGLEVIAEGVETEQQRIFLAQNGCHACQGYLFSAPLPIREFDEYAIRMQRFNVPG